MYDCFTDVLFISSKNMLLCLRVDTVCQFKITVTSLQTVLKGFIPWIKNILFL